MAPQARDDVLEHRVAELVGDLQAVDHPPLDERPGEQRDGHVEVEVGVDLAAQLGQLEHRADRAPPLLEHGQHEVVELGVAVAGGEQRGHEVGDPALLLLVLPRSKIVRRSSARSPVSGVGCSTKHDGRPSTTMACLVPKCR